MPILFADQNDANTTYLSITPDKNHAKGDTVAPIGWDFVGFFWFN